ncbi:hypothetical protein E5288_WYG001181 [Bos mutus]|uniref:Uncharacterized protein n=1 Tax=Bos mutus TaxID=72004 RepID=A0A6B0RX22_9CETA|nr:hypothetical protein [Bos mutus]
MVGTRLRTYRCPAAASGEQLRTAASTLFSVSYQCIKVLPNTAIIIRIAFVIGNGAAFCVPPESDGRVEEEKTKDHDLRRSIKQQSRQRRAEKETQLSKRRPLTGPPSGNPFPDFARKQNMKGDSSPSRARTCVHTPDQVLLRKEKATDEETSEVFLKPSEFGQANHSNNSTNKTALLVAPGALMSPHEVPGTAGGCEAATEDVRKLENQPLIQVHTVKGCLLGGPDFSSYLRKETFPAVYLNRPRTEKRTCVIAGKSEGRKGQLCSRRLPDTPDIGSVRRELNAEVALERAKVSGTEGLLKKRLVPPTAWKPALQPAPAALAGPRGRQIGTDAEDGKWAVRSQDKFPLINC